MRNSFKMQQHNITFYLYGVCATYSKGTDLIALESDLQ